MACGKGIRRWIHQGPWGDSPGPGHGMGGVQSVEGVRGLPGCGCFMGLWTRAAGLLNRAIGTFGNIGASQVLLSQSQHQESPSQTPTQ